MLIKNIHELQDIVSEITILSDKLNAAYEKLKKFEIDVAYDLEFTAKKENAPVSV